MGLVALLAAAEASATERVKLSYSADAACPSAADFESAVRERVRRGQFAEPGELGREYRVRVWRQGLKSVARLEFLDAGGTLIAREVSAEDCAAAVRAIALVSALAIDAVVPEAAETPASSAPGPHADPKGGVPDRRPRTVAPVRPQPGAGSEHTERERIAEPRAVTRATGSSSVSTPWQPHVELGGRATLTTPKAPVALFGAELFGAVQDRGRTWLIQLGVAGERGTKLRRGPGQARFSFVGGRLEGCAFPFALGPRLQAMPCALLEAGTTIAEGFIAEPRTVVDPWLATGPTGRLRFDWGGAWAALEAGALFVLTHENHVFFGDVEGARTNVHNVPLVGAFAALGVAVDLK